MIEYQQNAVGVAQLAEHRTVDAVVEGSRPFIHPIKGPTI
jgi:hypothetical protein